MKSIFICLLQLGCLWASRDQYSWLDSPSGLEPEIGLLLKQGLKIGYLPESYVNGEQLFVKFSWFYFNLISIIFPATNCLWKPHDYYSNPEFIGERNGGDIDNKLGIRISKNFVSWGFSNFDETLGMEIPFFGFLRRDHEQAVLPHAIGCQVPTSSDKYISILTGQHGLKFLKTILRYQYQ